MGEAAESFEQPRSRVEQKLVARIGDVEIAHRQLADAILRRRTPIRPFSIVSRSGW